METTDRRGTSSRDEWDARYAEHDGHMWSGRPNGSLVAHLAALPVGRALDIGCGEGADAIWLARNGWQVTATDISSVAIDRARAAGRAAGVDVSFEATDVMSDAPRPRAFDLVTMSFPALEREPGLAAIDSIADAVRVGGHLLVIGHVHDELARAHAAEHGFDPDQYVSVADVARVVASEFAVEIDEECDRPDAPDDAIHHADRILLARRIAG